jgi:hypothetical protein
VQIIAMGIGQIEGTQQRGVDAVQDVRIRSVLGGTGLNERLFRYGHLGHTAEAMQVDCSAILACFDLPAASFNTATRGQAAVSADGTPVASATCRARMLRRNAPPFVGSRVCTCHGSPLPLYTARFAAAANMLAEIADSPTPQTSDVQRRRD